MTEPFVKSEIAPRVNSIADLLRVKKQTVAFAESCTGGLVAASFASQSGVSDVFLGGVVAYSNNVKFRVLNVPESIVQELGAVSQKTALAMAHGGRQALGADWVVGVTGIAGPTGGSSYKPVGTVCFSVVGPGFEWSSQELFTGDRNAVQRKSAEFALASLEAALRGRLPLDRKPEP